MKRFVPFRSVRPAISFLVDRRALAATTVLAAVAIVVAVVSLSSGDYRIGVLGVIKSLVGLGEARETLIVTQFRLPRILVAFLVGTALAVSGALLQGIARNPLASPDIIGITGGAAVAAVGMLVFFPDLEGAFLAPAAFVGAAAVATLMYLLAYKNGFSPIRLVLVGIGFGAAARSITTLLIVISPMYQASKALLWLTGSVYGTSWKDVAAIGPWIALLLPASFLISPRINALQLGREVDISIGGRMDRDVLLVTAISVALAGSAVAVAGGVAFVGLMAPHMARLLVGPVFERLLPAAAILGGTLVMGADLIGRTAIGTLDLPAGIFTAAIGAPFFIFLLYRSRQTL